jgi:hypothetical protein
MNDFAKTRQGKQFFEHDLPSLVKAITELNHSIKESNVIEEKKLLIEQKRYLNETRNARITGSGENSDNAE